MKSPAGEDLSLPTRRKVSRPRVLLGGKLVYGQWDLTADCTIRDLTDSGARIRLRSDALIHDPVWLINLSTGIAYGGAVVWRKSPDLGLRFERSLDLRTPITGPLHHLRRLWIDFAGR
jgi:hypothetical protein